MTLIEQACQSCGDLFRSAGPVREDFICLHCQIVGEPPVDVVESDLPSRCPVCWGSGVTVTVFASEAIEDACPTCWGSGSE